MKRFEIILRQSNCRNIISTILCLSLLIPSLKAEEYSVNPLEKIQGYSDGQIKIEIPSSLFDVIFESNIGKHGNSDLKPGINKVSGYRIQVFSDGRNQNTLESRAKARGNAILSKFPKYKGQIYSFSHSPNWYTRVGNFRTSAEANSALSELKKAFPGFASEMRVVKSQIILIKQ